MKLNDIFIYTGFSDQCDHRQWNVSECVHIFNRLVFFTARLDLYIHTYIFIMHQYLAKKTTKSQNKTHLAEITPLMHTLRSVRLRRDSPRLT